MQTSKKEIIRGLAMIMFLAIAAIGGPVAAQSDAPSRPAAPATSNPLSDLNRDIDIEDDPLHPAALPANNSWPEMNLNVVVLDKHGAPQKVDEREFQLFEDGAARPITFRGSPDSPVSLAFIIDSSHSMSSRSESVVTAVKEIVKGLPDGSEIMAVSFADQAFVDLPFTPVSSADLSFLDRMNARGGTALNDTTIAVEKYFATHARYVRRALVLISDGDDDASRSMLDDAMRSLQWPGAPAFYSLFVHADDDPAVEVRHGRRAMELLAEAGGGVELTPKEKDFASALARLTDIIRSQYVLHFTAADPARDGKAHKLEVRLPGKDLRILALPAYYAPGK